MTEVKTPQGKTFFIRESERDQFVIDEQFVANVYQITPELIKGKTIIDAGANIGAFSVHCDMLGAKKVLAFEPEPHNWRLLQRNLASNSAASVVSFQKAITPESKEYMIVDEFGGSAIEDYYNGTQTDRYTCQGITLAEALNGYDHIDLLKIDIEKSEYPVLTQADDATLSNIDNIVMEYHEMNVEMWGDMVARLSQLFEVSIKGRQGHSGLLFAKRYE